MEYVSLECGKDQSQQEEMQGFQAAIPARPELNRLVFESKAFSRFPGRSAPEELQTEARGRPAR